jgi:CMP-N-acetylneuraminic acid synthetase
MKSHQLVALLPIKAHSERVPGKNFRNFAGRPLFLWILDTLLSLDSIEQVIINTDAEELLRSNGLPADDKIIIRERPPELCGDEVSMNEIIKDDIADIASATYLMTHATNPLLKAETIQNAWSTFQKERAEGFDSLFSANRVQTRFYSEDARPINHDPDKLVRTQELEPWYEENSNLYLFTRASFAATQARIGNKPILFPTPQMESADIDDETGWHLAEIIALSNLISRSTRLYAGSNSDSLKM